MEGPAAEPARLAALLPDVPRFVETRGMLLGGNCEVLGLEEDAVTPSFVVRDGEEDLVCVVRYPAYEAIAEALARSRNAGAVIAMPENVSRVAHAVPSREPQPTILHLLGEAERLPGATEGHVRLLSGPEEVRLLPPGLRAELWAELERILRRGIPAVGAFVGDVPVSFCYVASETEGFWDVSIDTLEEYQRQGYAAQCVASLIRHMHHTAGKEPVWGAVESNAASMGLAGGEARLRACGPHLRLRAGPESVTSKEVTCRAIDGELSRCWCHSALRCFVLCVAVCKMTRVREEEDARGGSVWNAGGGARDARPRTARDLARRT